MAGIRMLMQGGTAADAAVAVLAALNHVEPMSSGAGGSVVMTVYEASTGQVHALNAVGAVPRLLDASRVDAEDLDRGMNAGVVPGALGGWVALLERFGVMTLSEVLEPALEYADEGHPLDTTVIGAIMEARDLLDSYPSTATVLQPDESALLAGARWRSPALALTFRKLVEAEDTARINGADRAAALQAAFTRFYRGDIAREMARFYADTDGVFVRGDFAAYTPRWSEALHTTYRGYDVYSSPGLSRGGLEMVLSLNLLEGFDLESLGHNSADVLHVMTEVIKLAKRDVHYFVGDPAHTAIPVAGLTSKSFASTRRAQVSMDRAMPYPEPGAPPGATERSARGAGLSPFSDKTAVGASTSSFAVRDRDGNVVVATATLGSHWGTGVAVGTTGLFFANATRFGSSAPDQEHPNYPRGERRLAVDASPTLVLRDGEVVLALGAPGGEAIGPTQLQTLVNVLDFGMDIQTAVEVPRITLRADPTFYQDNAELAVQAERRLAPAVVTRLRELGHVVEVVGEYVVGDVQGIRRDPATGAVTAGGDPRGLTYAVGW